MARPEVGRGGHVSGRESRATSGGRTATARRRVPSIVASARQQELDERRKEAESRGDAFKYDRRCDRLSPDEVERRVAAGDPFVLRFRVPDGSTEWDDLVHERITFPNKDIEDFVILRSDGTPIYNMAVVSDDIDVAHHGRHARRRSHLEHAETDPAVSGVRRSTPGVRSPADDSRHRRQEAQQASRRHGRLATIVIRASCRSRWTTSSRCSAGRPGGDREVMTIAEMIEHFSPDGLLKKASVFDLKKLEWMNGQHLQHDAARRRRAVHHAGRSSRQDWRPRIGSPRTASGTSRCIDLLRVRSRTVQRCRSSGGAVLRRRRHARPRRCRKTVEGSSDGRAAERGSRFAGGGQCVASSADGGGAARRGGATRDWRRKAVPAASRRPHRNSGQPRDLRRARAARPRSIAGTDRRRAARICVGPATSDETMFMTFARAHGCNLQIGERVARLTCECHDQYICRQNEGRRAGS